MRFFVLAALAAATVFTAVVVGACSSDPASDANPDAAGSEGGPGGGGSSSGDGAQDAGKDGARDGAKLDGDTETDGAIPDDGGVIVGGDPPSVQLIGRFEKDAVGDNFAFPGSKIVARFNGEGAVVKLRQTDGFSGGPTWFNVVVDGVLQPKLMVPAGAAASYTVAQFPMAGPHTVELEKRTEGNLGVVRYEGFTFPNGGALLGPPARPARRIEFLADSTIDGFGVEGSIDVNAGNYCGAAVAPDYGAPPQFSNARKSMAALTAAALGADEHLIAYSGKGLTKNGDPGDTLLFQMLYDRALPDSEGSVYGFAWKPDAVVISLGGVDFDGLVTAPAGFAAGYGSLVDKARLHYPNAWIFLTVWSQIKDDNIPTRTAMKNSLQGIVNARGGDAKLSVFLFPKANGGADETGCQQHGNEAHHAAMAGLLTTELKNKLGW